MEGVQAPCRVSQDVTNGKLHVAPEKFCNIGTGNQTISSHITVYSFLPSEIFKTDAPLKER